MWECGAPNLPSSEEVTKRTEQVTKRIQELWMAMQDPSQREAFVPCAERIRVAVAELTAIFPQVKSKIYHIYYILFIIYLSLAKNQNHFPYIDRIQ